MTSLRGRLPGRGRSRTRAGRPPPEPAWAADTPPAAAVAGFLSHTMCCSPSLRGSCRPPTGSPNPRWHGRDGFFGPGRHLQPALTRHGGGGPRSAVTRRVAPPPACPPDGAPPAVFPGGRLVQRPLHAVGEAPPHPVTSRVQVGPTRLVSGVGGATPAGAPRLPTRPHARAPSEPSTAGLGFLAGYWSPGAPVSREERPAGAGRTQSRPCALHGPPTRMSAVRPHWSWAA